MMFSYSTCMIYACTSHACTLCTRIQISAYQYLTRSIMVYIFIGKYVNEILNVKLTYSLM